MPVGPTIHKVEQTTSKLQNKGAMQGHMFGQQPLILIMFHAP